MLALFSLFVKLYFFIFYIIFSLHSIFLYIFDFFREKKEKYFFFLLAHTKKTCYTHRSVREVFSEIIEQLGTENKWEKK